MPLKCIHGFTLWANISWLSTIPLGTEVQEYGGTGMGLSTM